MGRLRTYYTLGNAPGGIVKGQEPSFEQKTANSRFWFSRSV
jgi:hypothetical protein